MFKQILRVLLLTFIVSVHSQKSQFSRFLEYLSNITVNDLSNVLRVLPISNPLIFDGEPVGLNGVTFYLYTRQNPNIPVHLKPSSTKFSYLNPENEVKFIVHGWLEDANRTYYHGLKDAYFKRGNYNVIGVDWEKPARNEYSVAARNTKTAGRALGDFIIRLNKIAGIPLNQIHILGHSLGAHVAGFAGKRIISRMGQKIGRISALDAAGPLFETPVPVSKQNRLDRNDANFVDCIHTDGGIFGMTQAICDADFYPNGGMPRQPGCSMINVMQLSYQVIIDDHLRSMLQKKDSNINILHYIRNVFCSHYRSHEYFTESINSNGFQATLCESYEKYRAGLCSRRAVIPMGENTPVTTRGKFFLLTNASPPYAIS